MTNRNNYGPAKRKKKNSCGGMAILLYCLLTRRYSILENNVESVNNTREPTQTSQQNVDEQVRVAASLEEDTQRRENDS